MSTTKNYHWRIAGFYFFYYAFVGMFAPYWSLYLKSIHFDAIEISILMSVQPVMRMVAPSIWGWLADHTGAQQGCGGHRRDPERGVLSRGVRHHQFLGPVAGAGADEFFLDRLDAVGGSDHADLAG